MSREDALKELLSEEEVNTSTPEINEEAADVEEGGSLEQVLEPFELSEEVQKKVSDLFEAAVEKRVAELEEQYKTSLKEKEEELKNQTDAYLQYVVEEWVLENKESIQNSVKMEIMESFMSGLRKLFLEHDIDVPECSENIYDQLTAKINSLEEDVAALASRNAALKRELIFKELTEDVTKLEAEKIRAIVEEKEFDTLEDFKRGVETVKESIATIQANMQEDQQNLNEEEQLNSVVKQYYEFFLKKK